MTDIESNNQECPICFNNINIDDPYFTLSCCNNNVHINCLELWYEKKQSPSFKCFLCTKNNNELKSILNVQKFNNSTPEIESVNIPINYNNFSNRNYVFVCCPVICFICLGILLIFI